LTRRLLAVAGLVLAAGFGAAAASGHGLDVEVRLHSPAVVLRAAYSGAEAVAYAAVKIYAPGASTVEFQSGNADASGRFAFVPDHEGEWRAVVDDELGHREERLISIGRDFFAAGLVLRGWKRARAVQSAMEARGFDGSFPGLRPSCLRPRDVLAAAAFLAPFVAVRMFRP